MLSNLLCFMSIVILPVEEIVFINEPIIFDIYSIVYFYKNNKKYLEKYYICIIVTIKYKHEEIFIFNDSIVCSRNNSCSTRRF